MNAAHTTHKGSKMPHKGARAKTVSAPPMKHAHKGLKMIPNKGIKAQGTQMAEGKKVSKAVGSDSSKVLHGKAIGRVTKTTHKFSSKKYEAVRRDVFGLSKKEDSGKI
jgi:hypothetical protein